MLMTRMKQSLHRCAAGHTHRYGPGLREKKLTEKEKKEKRKRIFEWEERASVTACVLKRDESKYNGQRMKGGSER